MPTNQIPDPWREFFSEIDSRITKTVEFHCLGGFVVTSYYDLPRPTADVDVVSIAPADIQQELLRIAGEFSELHKKYKIYLDFVTITNLPEDYDLRLTEMFPGSFTNLRLFALDPYDLALSKLERNIDRDREDVLRLAHKINLDLEVLKQRYEKELRPIVSNQDREDLTLKLWIDMITEYRENLEKRKR